LGDILTNFRQKYAEIRAKLKTKNNEAAFGIVLKFCKEGFLIPLLFDITF